MAKKITKAEAVKEAVTQDTDFRLEQLFGSKTRVSMLRFLLDTPDRAYYVRELTRRIDAQLNSVRRELQNLVDIGIVQEVEGNILEGEKRGKAEAVKTVDRKKYYKVDKDFPFFKELRGIMKKASVLMNKAFVEELQRSGNIDLLVLTGKFMDAKDVPSDILIVGSIAAKPLQNAVEMFETQIGREINYTYMPREEFVYRREVKDRFLSSLLSANGVMLINEIGDDI
ncbi:hypothetical protein KJ766_03110 [Patescibacteria group bacterium]|nr:hypothetical protein [Patescibacteria group bacterium]